MDFEWGIGTLGPVRRGELNRKVDGFSADRGLDFVVEKRASGGSLYRDARREHTSSIRALRPAWPARKKIAL